MAEMLKTNTSLKALELQGNEEISALTRASVTRRLRTNDRQGQYRTQLLTDTEPPMASPSISGVTDLDTSSV